MYKRFKDGGCAYKNAGSSHLKGRYTRGDMSLQHVTNVAATRRCDKPPLVNRWGDKLLQQLAATLRVYKISDEVEC